MRNSEPPQRRNSLPPGTPEEILAYLNNREPPSPVFTRHKELASFLASDSTKIFLAFISFSLMRRNLTSKDASRSEPVLRELNSRLPKHFDRIFAELSPEAREAAFALMEKLVQYSAQILAAGGSPKTNNLEKAFSLARSAGKNAEQKGATPAETALVVCGVFAASAKVLQSQKESDANQFIKLAEGISSQMSAQATISFLWKIADLKNDAERRVMVEEILRLHGNERKIIQLLSS